MPGVRTAHLLAGKEPPVTALAFEARGLAVGFPGGVLALRGVDLEVSTGEIVGVVGESGSGKSVLGLAALGLLSGDARVSGQALLSGTDMVTASGEQRRLARRSHAGAVFQDPMTSLNPTKRVGAQLMEVCDSRELAVRLLTEVNVPEPSRRFDQYPHELSGGLRQRVMIAMAVARRPTLVVADEPTTALDVTVQAEIVRLFRNLRDELGVAFLFITHDLALAAQICDRIVVMYGGRVAEMGTAVEILQRPRHPYSSALLRTRLTLEVDTSMPLPTLPGEPPDARRHRDECPFAPRCRFVQERCRHGLPVLMRLAAPTVLDPLRLPPEYSHEVACLRADEIEAGAAVMATGDSSESEPTPVWPGGGSVLAAVVDVRRSGRGTLFAAGPSMLGEALVVRGLAKAFDGHQAVREVAFEIAPGKALALVGESGCGKTTTLRMIVGLERPDRGEILLARGPRPQMIFQDVGASLTPWMTVLQLLQERLRCERVDRALWPERIDAVLALAGLSQDLRQSRPARLSGGQRQRVALARAVIVAPRLLVCDEPTSALDVSLASTVLNLLNTLRSELGMAMLIVTHDLAVARATAEHIAVMRDGEIVERGEIERVLRAPATGYTRQLLDAVPTIPGGF